jgi:hypothetical protein
MRGVLPPRLVFVLALAALWWPGRLAGIFDGAPLDSAPDAVVLGLILPVLLAVTPAVCRDRRVQVLVIALLAWKIFSFAAVTQDGFCVRVVPLQPVLHPAPGALKNWDSRTDWLSADPRCTAIADRPYVDERQFPLWLPFSFAATATGSPPSAPFAQLTMSGSVLVKEAGTLRLWTSPTVDARLRVDGAPARAEGAALAAGHHDLVIDASVRDFNWILAPLWNERNLFAAPAVTVTPPSALDAIVRPWGGWISFALVAALIVLAVQRMYAAVGEWPLLVWIAAAAAAGVMIAALLPGRWWHYALVPLLAAGALRVPAALQNLRGAFLLLAPCWLAMVIVDTYYDQGFGRMDSIAAGNDWWTFQLAAYRIYMQGHWLEGGEPTFWYQPFYRWIAGALHMVFGQSQVGENYWDALAILAIALFSVDAVRRVWGFTWAYVAGVVAVIAFVAGPGYIFIGRGLSEISSAAFLYLAAMIVTRAREEKSIRLLLVAGGLAVLGTWTRLNNLPMAVAIIVFAWPLSEPAATLWQPRSWLARVWYPPLIVVPAVIAFGMFLFALRTWYYTGVFSIFHGTQAGALAVWRSGMGLDNVARNMIDSVMMVATTTDPPAYHNGALPILAGAALSVAALTGAGLPGRLPLPLIAFTLGAFASALIARGTAYPGRFSIHVIGATVAVTTCAIAGLVATIRKSRLPVSSRP